MANTRSSHNNQIAYMHHCLQIGPQGKKDGSVGLATCLPEGSPDEAPQRFPCPDRPDSLRLLLERVEAHGCQGI